MDSVNILECASIQEAMPVMKQVQASLIFCSASNQEHLVKHITMMRLLNQPIKAGKCKVLVMTSIPRATIENILMKNGCSEILEETIAEKPLQHKVQHFIRMLQPHLKQQQSLEQKKVQTKGQVKTDLQMKKAATSSVQMVAPLTIQSDCWLMHTVGSGKKIRGQWLIRLVGPSPAMGKWIDRSSAANRGKSDEAFWEWVPTVKNDDQGKPVPDPFIREEGSWQFKGQRPFFAENTWNFTSRNPSLVFVKGQERLGVKLHMPESGDLWIAKDSDVGKKLIPLIEDSLKIKTKTSSKGEESERKTKSRLKKDEATGSATDAGTVIWEPAIPLKSDCWIVAGDTKRVSGRWLVRLKGPAPSVGKWVEAEGPTSDRWWKWEPLDAKDYPFTVEKGEWFFRGFEPKFQEDIWVFVGVKPELSYYHEKKNLGSRVFFDEAKKIHIAKDSQAAIDFLPLIEQTLEQVVREMERRKAAGEENVKGKNEVLSDEELVNELEKEGKGDGVEVEEEAVLDEESESSQEESEEEAAVARSAEDSETEDTAEIDAEEEAASGKKKRKTEEESAEELSASEGASEKAELTMQAATSANEKSKSADAEDVDGSAQKKKNKREAEFNEAEEVDAVIAEGSEEDPERAADLSADTPEGTELNGKFAAEKSPDGKDLKTSEDLQKNAKDKSFEKEDSSGREINNQIKPEDAKSGAEPSIEKDELQSNELILKNPPLEPLFFAFLASELLTSREITTQVATEKFLIALSQALRGRQVELWGGECMGRFPNRPSELPLKEAKPDSLQFPVKKKDGQVVATLWVEPATEEQAKERNIEQDQQKLEKIAGVALGLALSNL